MLRVLLSGVGLLVDRLSTALDASVAKHAPENTGELASITADLLPVPEHNRNGILQAKAYLRRMKARTFYTKFSCLIKTRGTYPQQECRK